MSVGLRHHLGRGLEGQYRSAPIRTRDRQQLFEIRVYVFRETDIITNHLARGISLKNARNASIPLATDRYD